MARNTYVIPARYLLGDAAYVGVYYASKLDATSWSFAQMPVSPTTTETVTLNASALNPGIKEVDNSLQYLCGAYRVRLPIYALPILADTPPKYIKVKEEV